MLFTYLNTIIPYLDAIAKSSDDYIPRCLKYLSLGGGMIDDFCIFLCPFLYFPSLIYSIYCFYNKNLV